MSDYDSIIPTYKQSRDTKMYIFFTHSLYSLSAVPVGCQIAFKKSISYWLLAKTWQFLSIFPEAACLVIFNIKKSKVHRNISKSISSTSPIFAPFSHSTFRASIPCDRQSLENVNQTRVDRVLFLKGKSGEIYQGSKVVSIDRPSFTSKSLIFYLKFTGSLPFKS